MERYRELINELKYIDRKFESDEYLTTPELQKLHNIRDWIIRQLIKTSLFKFILIELIYIITLPYYRIKLNWNKNNEGDELPF